MPASGPRMAIASSMHTDECEAMLPPAQEIFFGGSQAHQVNSRRSSRPSR